VTSARRTCPHIPAMLGFPFGNFGAGEFRAGNSLPYGYQPDRGGFDCETAGSGARTTVSRTAKAAVTTTRCFTLELLSLFAERSCGADCTKKSIVRSTS